MTFSGEKQALARYLEPHAFRFLPFLGLLSAPLMAFDFPHSPLFHPLLDPSDFQRNFLLVGRASLFHAARRLHFGHFRKRSGAD